MSNKPSVLVIAADLKPEDLGGAEVHLVETLKRLAGKFDFTVLVGPSDVIKTCWPISVRVVSVKYFPPVNFQSIFFTFYAIVIGLRLCRTQHFSLIWAKQEFPQALAAGVISLFYRLPIYVTAQNPLAFEEEFVLLGPLAVFRPLINFCLRQTVGWSLRRADLVAAVSQYSASLAKSFGARTVTVVPNGVDLQVFRPSPLPARKRFTLVTTSTLIPRNATDVTIKALSLLPASIPWHFQIAGDGPEKEELQRLVTRLRLSERVEFLGTLSPKEVPAFLRQADLFVRPSRYEGFGVSFLEAMAVNVPVITTHSGGQKDFVIPYQTGLVVPVDDIKALTQAIETVFTNTSLRRSVIRNARKMVVDRYNWDNITADIYNHFETLVNK